MSGTSKTVGVLVACIGQIGLLVGMGGALLQPSKVPAVIELVTSASGFFEQVL